MCYKQMNLFYNMENLGKLTRHHRRPQSLGGKHEGENISFVPDRLHAAWHLLFANNSAQRIAEIINDHWIDPNVYMVPIPREMLEQIFLILKKTKK